MADRSKDNYRKGKEFQELILTAVETFFGRKFEPEKDVPIGQPTKLHKFDMVSVDKKVIVETKNHSWTESGRVPSAKLSVLNEVLLFLQNASAEIKVLILRRDYHVKRGESLAEYYVRKNRHLLRDVIVLEYDITSNTLINILENSK